MTGSGIATSIDPFGRKVCDLSLAKNFQQVHLMLQDIQVLGIGMVHNIRHKAANPRFD